MEERLTRPEAAFGSMSSMSPAQVRAKELAEVTDGVPAVVC